MKTKKYIAMVLALVLVLLTVSTVSAKTERTYFSVHEICDWSTTQIAREIMNGQGNYLAKHWTQICYHDNASIPQMTGSVAIDLNINIVGNGIWKWTGKGHWVTDEGGVWETNCVYPWPKDLAHCQGKGEGIYTGYQLFMDGAGEDGMWNGYITFNSQ